MEEVPVKPREYRPAWLTQAARWRPEVTNPVLVWALGVGEKITGTLTRNLRVSAPPGREKRFEMRIRNALAPSVLMDEANRVGGITITILVRESFGKPTLVSVDISLTREQMDQVRTHLLDPDQEEAQLRTYDLFLADFLERVVQEVWDNPEIAPVGVRGRLIITGENPEVLLDMTDLGYRDEIARPADLYERLGAPASDPLWRP